MLINKLMYGVRLFTEQRSSYTRIENLRSHHYTSCSLPEVTGQLTLSSLGIQKMCKVLTIMNS